MPMNSVSRKTVSLLIFAAWIAASVSLNGLLIRKKNDFKTPVDQPPFIWQPDLYRILTFGHVPSAVDSLLLKFLVEDNIKHVEKGVVARVYYFLDLATDLDPAFFSLYTAGSNFLAVVRDDKVSAMKLISKGEKFRKNELAKYPKNVREEYWADEWRVPFIKGYVHLFEMHDILGAAEAYGELESIPEAPPIARGMGKHFGKPGGIYEIGLNVLRGMIGSETDENVLQELKKQQKSLALSLDLFRINEALKTYKGGWERYQREKKIPKLDAYGGKIFIGPDGKVDSTTERVPNFPRR
jgi:hypothetical protein